jgi:hypothetical protein
VERPQLEPPQAPYADPQLLAAVTAAGVEVPRGEPRRLVADVAAALAAYEPPAELQPKLEAAAEALWDDDEELALAAAYHAALPVLARTLAASEPLEEAEQILAQLDEEDRAARALGLARLATPALGVDVELMKDEGYRYVATYPREGSEGVDIVGMAAKWLTKRMTIAGDGPRVAMRRFFALLAEEAEVERPLAAAQLDRLAAEPMPEAPVADQAFLALARGLVEQAVHERGFPF